MAKLSPKDLDKIFQKGSEQYDFEYNEEAWKHMEGLLEKDDRRRFLWWWFAGIAALMLFGLMYYFISSSNSIQSQNEKIDKIEASKNENNLSIESQNNETNFDKNTLENKEASQITLNDKSQSSDLNTNKTDGSVERLKLDNNTITNRNSNSKPNPNFPNHKTGNPGFENTQTNKSPLSIEFKDVPIGKTGFSKSSQPTIFGEPIMGKDTLNLNKKRKEIHLTPLAFLKIQMVDFVSMDLPNLEELGIGEELAVAFDTINLKKNENQKEDEKNKNAFLIGAMIGGEISTIGKNRSERELKYGGQLEYRFLKKWSTSVGVSYIKKDYGAAGDDYFVEYGYWEDGIAPTKVYAHCDMLEIPVKVSYFFKDFSKNGFYSSLGLTSYLMRNEKYYYQYEVETPTQRKYWKGSNENNHWFGLGHLAVGYQYHLGARFLVQIEPYAELPITKIGHGNVRLWSFGVSTKFNFQIK